MNYNKIVILGRVGRDPELKALPNGNKVCTFSLATSRTWKDNNGSKQEETEWHNVVFWNKPAEIIAQYVKKGSLLLIDGHLQTRSWDDKETGKKVYRTEIIGETVQLPPKGISGGSNEGPQDEGGLNAFDGPDKPTAKKEYPKKKSALQEKVESVQGNIDYPSDELSAEEIPF
jgi:single-strand DNA-binding protein